MKIADRVFVFSMCTLALSVPPSQAQDWPQWRGPNRDAKAVSFAVPQSWPKELAQKWKVTVGDGVATPSLAGDHLYVFARQDGQEILRCLDAASGKELWQDKYETPGASGPAQRFSGPRCSPTVADGKVVTLGVQGVLSCYDATSGKLLWRKDDFAGAVPKFFTSSSPLVTQGLCIAELGGGSNGGIIAYDLASGTEKWRWSGDAPAYASPVLMTLDNVQLLVTQTETKMVALSVADGKLQWEAPFAVAGRGYNAATPIVEGPMIIYTGSNRGVTAVRLEKDGDHYAAKPLWKNDQISVQFNSPVLKDKFIYGITGKNELFCLNVADGQTVWTAAAPAPAGRMPAPGAGAPPGNSPPPGAPNPGAGPGPGRGPGGPGGEGRRGRGGMRGGGGGGYGSVVDAGSVILALTPASQLIAFTPGTAAYAELARIKVADSPTYAYPVLSGNRIFVKDQDSVTLWTLQ